MNRSELWNDGEKAILYSRDVEAVRDVLRWEPMRAAGVQIMAEYEDKKGRLIALQIRFPRSLENRVARRMGLTERKQRVLSDADKEARAQRIRQWQFEPPKKGAGIAA